MDYVSGKLLSKVTIRHYGKLVMLLVLVFAIVVKLVKISQLTNVINQTKLLFQKELQLRRTQDSILPVDWKASDYTIDLVCSKSSVELAVDGEILHQQDYMRFGHGLDVIIVNLLTQKLMGYKQFSLFGNDFKVFLQSILHRKNIAIAFVARYDQAMAGFKLLDLFKDLGSKITFDLKGKNFWCMIATVLKGNINILNEKISQAADITQWPDRIYLRTVVNSTIATDEESPDCNFLPQLKKKVQLFCSKYVSYKALCSCALSQEDFKEAENFKENQVFNIPVVIIAANRPTYLFRMLRKLLMTEGVNKELLTVYIDGAFEETMDVAKLFDINAIFHYPSGLGNARISQHYLSSLTHTFSRFPDAKFAIILEEDLEVSPDFFRYFSQTLFLLREDPSLYCISAWNDQGYAHSSQDTGLLYRIETMPGLGWILKRSLFEEELKAKWPGPDKQWDWDMWLRHPENRKGRECAIPDVSRTFHFGEVGVNINNNFYSRYFKTRIHNTDPHAQLRNISLLLKVNYEKHFHKLVRNSHLVNHSKSPCDSDFAPFDSSDSYVAYFNSDKTKHTFLKIANCLKIWDLDVRGLHKNAFRTFIRKTIVIFVGYPHSAYSMYKPFDVMPIQ